MNPHGCIMACGLIADYSKCISAPGPGWMNILKRSLTVQGFTRPDHFSERPALVETLTPYVMAGQIKVSRTYFRWT
jgi:NADPH-dependent curcumin reductase CurA